MNDRSTPLPFPPETRHLPLVFLAVLVVNAVILRQRYAHLSRDRPDLASGYRKYSIGLLCCLGLPWVIVAIGLESGGIPNFFALFHPRDGNPFVLAFYGINGAMLLGFVGWILLGHGAEFMVRHAGTMKGNPWTVTGVRLWAVAVGVGGCVGLALRLFDIPHLPF